MPVRSPAFGGFYGGSNLPSPPGHGGSPFASGGYVNPERSWVEYWLKRNRNKKADIEFFKYACPEGTKYHRIKLPNCDEELLVTSTAGRTTFAPGSRVVIASHQGQRQKIIVGSPPPGQVGVTNFPVISDAIEMSTLNIISADPYYVLSGIVNQEVELYGFGFSENPLDVFDAVKYNEDTKEYDADPYIAIHDVVWVSNTRVDIQVSVSGLAPEGYSIDVKVERA